MATCQPESKLETFDCCETYTLRGNNYEFVDVIDDRPVFYSAAVERYIVYISYTKKWYVATSKSVYENFAFYDENSSNKESEPCQEGCHISFDEQPASTCPPMKGWESGDMVLCKSNGTSSLSDTLEFFCIDRIYSPTPNCTIATTITTTTTTTTSTIIATTISNTDENIDVKASTGARSTAEENGNVKGHGSSAHSTTWIVLVTLLLLICLIIKVSYLLKSKNKTRVVNMETN